MMMHIGKVKTSSDVLIVCGQIRSIEKALASIPYTRALAGSLGLYADMLEQGAVDVFQRDHTCSVDCRISGYPPPAYVS